MSSNSVSTASDGLLTNNGDPAGTAIVLDLPFPVPFAHPIVLTALAILLLTGDLIVIRRGPMLAGVGLILFSSTVIAAGFIVDGNLGDWIGVHQLASDRASDPTITDNIMDLTAFFSAVEGSNFFARINMVDFENNTPVANAGANTTLMVFTSGLKIRVSVVTPRT